MNLRFSKFVMLATLMSVLGTGTPEAFGQQGYVQYYDPAAPLPSAPVVLDTRMKATYVRAREVQTASGAVERVVEPIIMERFERVAKPAVVSEKTFAQTTSQTTGTTTRAAARRVASASVRRHHPIRRAHRSTARRSNTQVASGTRQRTVIREKVVTSAAIIERRDPALNVIDATGGP